MRKNRQEIRQLEKLMNSVVSLQDNTTEEFAGHTSLYDGVLGQLQTRYLKLTGNQYKPHTQTIERRAKK